MAKISISIEEDLYRRVQEAAGADGVSGWLVDAVAMRLRIEALRSVADEIADSTGGSYTESELDDARAWLPSSSTRVA